ncbi:MAG: THUMP domain-containing protein [Geobacteraceae bacterium]|nr:THUMP domain-containing protein [Geobacteraceae bacterium]
MEFFATAAKGLEELVAGELAGLGIEEPVVERGGVRFAGDLSACYRANLWLRTAQRILLPLGEFPCDTQQLLYDGVRALPWADYLNPDMTLAVNCNLRDSALKHSGFVALKTKDAIVDSIRDRCGRRPSVDTRDPDLLVNVHLARNRCTISLDTSGASLDKRGYRLDRKEAPLRETLAAAIVELSGWDGTVPLIDPMCGSGTIPIEAALKASCRPPGLTRPGFGFRRWPGFDPVAWQGLLQEAGTLSRDSLTAPIIGSDASASAIRIACRNAARAGVDRLIGFRVEEMSRCAPSGGKGVLVFNPPYGVRLGEEESLKTLYREIGDVMKRRFSGYTAYLLTGNPELAKHVGLKASRRIVLFNGPIECRLLRYELY